MSDRRRNDRGLLNYYAPLAFTVTVAVIGVAAWIWKERNDHHEEEYDDYWDGGDNRRRRNDDRPPPPAPNYSSSAPPGHRSYATGVEPGAPPPPGVGEEDPNIISRMQGVLRRTSSPQQLFDGASKKMAAGMAAIGGALSSIREEDSRHYEEHREWSQEADAQRQRERAQATMQTASMPPQVPALGRSAAGATRRTVAIVVTADNLQHEADPNSFHTEHASILSHLPEHINDDSRVFILIYAPSLRVHPLSSSNKPAPSIASSYDVVTPGLDEPDESEKPLAAIEPKPDVGSIGGSPSLHPSPGGGPGSSSGATDQFRALYAQAQALVERDTMIMPFSTPTGYVQMVRHLAPSTVYVQSGLAGPGGESVKQIASWVGQVVLVVGDDSGHGGLVDSEDERVPAGGAATGEHGHDEGARWWQHDEAVGFGRGIEVVEGMRIGEDWRRRVRGHD